jgi:hypothetical protein
MGRHARIGRLFAALLGVALLLPAMAAERLLFKDGFAKGDTAAWTLQPPLNAIGPIPANGTWATAGNAFTAKGSAAPWTIQTAGDAAWTDYRVSATVTIQQPTPKADFPIYSCEFDRFLPREDFPPFSGHSGEYRYRYYAGEFDWGSDAAVYFRYQDRNACYRVQLSTEYQEIILWNAMGGYLQVVPCPLAPNRPYQLRIDAQGGHIQVFLDGAKKIDYWHDCLPSLKGGIGLAAYNSTVAFSGVTVAALPAAGAQPPHQARFATRAWRTLRWVFDGNEPLFQIEKNPYPDSPVQNKNNIGFEFVKLRPGYRPLYNTFVGIIRDNGYTTGLPGDLSTITTLGEGTEKLTLVLPLVTADDKLKTEMTDVLTFDRVRGTYRHDVTDVLTFTTEQRVSNLEYCDPLSFNNHAPGRGVKYRWISARDDWGVFTGEDGKIYRHPISIGLLLGEGWNTMPDKGFWFIYPGQAVCQGFEYFNPGQKNWIIVCHWGHDWHSVIQYPQGRTFKAGEQLTIKYAMVGYPHEEAERYYTQSDLNPLHANLEEKQKANHFLYVPTPYAFPICDPAGTSFEQLQSAREPFNGWHYYGDYSVDNTVGRTDHASMRLDGPALVNGTIYHNMLDIYAKQYLCTFWLKTKNLKGNIKVKLWYPWDGAKGKRSEMNIALPGTNDWQQVSFITDVMTQHDGTEFIVQVEGAGTVWVDDFSIRGIEPGEKVEEHLPFAKVDGPVPVANPDVLIDLPCDEGEGLSLYDASNHGGSAKLHGVTWVDGGKRPVLHFANGTAGFISGIPTAMIKAPNFYAPTGVTLEAWVRPQGPGSIIGYQGSPALSLTAKDATHFLVNMSVLKTPVNEKNATPPPTAVWENLTSTVDIPTGQWSHVAGSLLPDGTLRVYVNGKPAGEKKLAAVANINFGSWFQSIAIGTNGKFYGNNYVGDMTAIRWWARAATDAEIAARAELKL